MSYDSDHGSEDRAVLMASELRRK